MHSRLPSLSHLDPHYTCFGTQFKTYDSDGSGYISCEEFRSLVKDLLAVHAEPEEETIAEAAEKLASLSESQTNLLRKAQKDTANQAFVCLSIDSPLRLAAKRVVENRCRLFRLKLTSRAKDCILPFHACT